MPGYYSIPSSAYPQSYTMGVLDKINKTGAYAPAAVTGGKVQPKPGVRNVSGNINPGTTASGAFDINPPPQAGQGPFGAVPGPIQYPTTPYAEATRIYPGLANLTPQVGEEIRSQVAGEFTPMEENALWDLANRFGVASGMPGAQLWSNKFFGNRIEEGMKRRQQGVENYNVLLQELSKMGMDPALAAQIAAWNATNRAAPDPEAAAKELRKWYQEQLNAGASPAAGTISRINPNSYGAGFTPMFNSPAAGTVTPTTGRPQATYVAPTNPTKTGGWGKAWNSAGGYADTSEVALPSGSGRAWNSEGGYAQYGLPTAGDFTDDYGLDYLMYGTDPYGAFTSPMYEDEYNWLWNEPTQNVLDVTPIYDEEANWLAGEDPWAIYDYE